MTAKPDLSGGGADSACTVDCEVSSLPAAWPQETPRGSRYLNGVRWTLITNFVGAGFAAVSGIIIARFLDPSGYGKYRTVTYLVGFCAAVAGFELRDAMRRFIPTVKQSNPEKVAAVVLGGCGIVASLSLLVAAGFYFGAPFVAAALYKDPSLAALLRWSGILVATSAASALMEAALTGFELYKAATARSLLAQSIGIPLQLALAWHFGVTGALWGFAILTGGRAVILGTAAAGACGFHSLAHVAFGDMLQMAAGLLRFSLPLLITALLIPFANWWLSARLAAMGGMVQVGLFAVAYGLIQLLTTIMLAAGVPLIPLVAEASATSTRQDLNRIVCRGTLAIALLLVVPGFILGANARTVILLLYGHRFSAAAPILFLFALASVPVGIVEGLGRSLVGMGQVPLAVAGHVVWLGTIVTTFEVYGWRHGAAGCAQSFLAAELLQAVFLITVYQLYLHFDMRPVIKMCLVCGVAMIPAYFLSSAFSGWSIAAFLATFAAVLAALWYGPLAEGDRALIRNGLLRGKFACLARLNARSA